MTINNELFESYVAMNNRHLDENLASLKEALLKMAASMDALQNGGKDFNCLKDCLETLGSGMPASHLESPSGPLFEIVLLPAAGSAWKSAWSGFQKSRHWIPERRARKPHEVERQFT